TPNSAASPPTRMSRLKTTASTGRRTNSAAMPPVPPSVRCRADCCDMLRALALHRRAAAAQHGNGGSGPPALDALDDDLVPGGDIAGHQHIVGIALHDLHVDALRPVAGILPQIGTAGAPLDGERVDGNMGIALEIQVDAERHSRPQPVVAIVDAGADLQR